MNDINDRYDLRIDAEKRQALGLQIKQDIDAYAKQIMIRTTVIGLIILAALLATHYTLSAIDGAHEEWLHDLVFIFIGINSYIAISVIAEARNRKHIVCTCINSLLKTGHIKDDKKGLERDFEETLEGLYKSVAKAHLLILAMYAPDHLIVNRPNMETSHATINYYAPSHHHMCFSVKRSKFYEFYTKPDNRTLEWAGVMH